MTKQLINCDNPKCKNQIATEKIAGKVQCKICGKRTEL